MNRANLTGLPADLILQILQHLAAPIRGLDSNQEKWPGLKLRVPEGEWLCATQSMRLTCRTLSQAVTPVLFPVLYVSINHHSIDMFEQMSKNHIIAGRVHGVIVNVAAYSSNMATSLSMFKKTRQFEIDGLLDRLTQQIQPRLLAANREPEEDDEVKNYHRLRDKLNLLGHEWSYVSSTYVDDDSNNTQLEREAADELGQRKFLDILLSGYSEYRRRHQEQLECLNDTQTLKQLVTSFSRLACGGKLRFSTTQRRVLRRHSACLQLHELLDNPETLSHLMAQPYSWADLHGEGRHHDSSMVKILSKLPIALAEAGVPLTELYLGCFPHYSGFSQLLSYEGQQVEELERELQLAFQHLRVFDFAYREVDSKQRRLNPLPESDLLYMRAYLRAVLASSQLRTLKLNFYTYGINTGQRDKVDDYFQLGPVLRSCKSSRLTDVRLSNFEIKFEELEPFLSHLSPKLRYLDIYKITVSDGYWAPLLDAMRHGVSQCRRQGGRCKVALSTLFGAEFGNEHHSDALFYSRTYSRKNHRTKLPLIMQAHAYIHGKTDINPLRTTEAVSASPC